MKIAGVTIQEPKVATQAETNAGTDDARIVTPKKLASYTGLRGMKNLLINGSMVIGQRAADQTLDQTLRYGRVDRWHAFWNSATGVTPGTQGHQNSVNTESYKVMALTPLTCTGTNSLFIGQRIESVNSRLLRKAADYGGLSFQIKVWHNFSAAVNMELVVYTANTTDTFSAVTGRYTSTAQSVPASTFTTLKFEGFSIGTTDVDKGIAVYLKVTTPVCSGATMYIGDAQLEVGPVCTDLERRPFGTELALCQRYFVVFGASNDGQDIIGSGVSEESSTAMALVNHPVEMRALPSLSYSSANHFAFRVASGGNNTATNITLSSISGTRDSWLSLTLATNPAAGYGGIVRSQTSGGRLYLSAEL